MRIMRIVLVIALLAAFIANVQGSGRGRHAKLYVVPRQNKVTIDAKLDDWDLSGQILSYVVPETADMQSARLAMMYDDEALYISGVVRDTSPMMNRHDPKTDPQKAWDADVCQIFFSLDPDLPYPIQASSFNKKDANAPVATMLLWYYTDRKEPSLAMYRGMRFNKPVRPDLGAEGVIPHEHFDAAYRKSEDERGYTFEYRIPWKTFGMKRRPKANDILAATLAVFWSRPDGLKTAGGAAWAYDVMGAPGFPFQSAACWGKLMFWPEGNVPRELVEEGLPPEKPLPLKFAYDVPEDSEVTVQILDEDKQVVRLLVAQQPRRAGKNVELWDGMDSSGNPLPAGTYKWKGIYHEPIETKWRFSVHNSGQPPYPTDNNRGGWGGDHGTPQTVCPIPGGMVLSWSACEYGWGIIRVNEDGKKLWGSKHNATYMATDGKRLFIAGGHGFHSHQGVQVLELRDSRPTNFAGKKATLAPPEGGDEKSNVVTGLAYHKGRIFVSYAGRDLIGVFDAKSGNMEKTWKVAAPGRIAVRPNGSLAVISDGKIVSVNDGKVSAWITANLDEPVGIAVAPDGTGYVANRGKLQNVSVFDKSGKYLRSIGKQGGRPAIGRYDKSGMYMAGGIGLDSEARLWVAETTDGPKRVSVWDTQSGENVKEYFGSSGYFGYGYIDSARPDEIYAHHVLWNIDWKDYKAEPYTTIWRKTAPNMMEAPSPSGYSGTVQIITARNGRQYIWGNAKHKSILMRREGDIFKPFAAMMHIGYGWSLYRGQGIPLLDDKEKYGNGFYFWQDANDDQTVQAEEVTALPRELHRGFFAWLDQDLNVRLKTGHVLRPQRVTKAGQPVYDVAKPEEDWVVGNRQARGYMWQDPAGPIYTFSSRKGPSLIKWSTDGTMLWNYPDIARWREALNLPIVGPGRLWGMTGPMGVAGDFFANMTYFGVNHVFTRDGVYVAALLKDGRLGGRGPYEGQPEGQGGQFVKLKIDGKDRYFIIHGGQDSRVWEVLGLDTVKPLAGGTYEHTEDKVKLAAQKLAEYKAVLAKSQQLTIVRGRTALDLAKPVARSVDRDRRFEARAAYDEENLYVRFDIVSPHPLLNATPEPQLVFRGGNLLDIQIATDPKADPERKKPAPGDLRLLITQQKRKPFAVIYRPKVEGFKGKPTVFKSPTGQEAFDVIEQTDKVGLQVRKIANGFSAVVTVPLDLLGWQPKPGQTVRMDLGYIFGNAQGTRTAARAYWSNDSFTANVTNDVPHESRLEPGEWGEARVE